MEALSVSSPLFSKSPSSLIIFCGSECPDAFEIDQFFVSWSLKNIIDPTIWIVGDLKKIKDFLSNDGKTGGAVRGLERLSHLSELRFAGFDCDGSITELSSTGVSVNQDLADAFQKAVQQFIKCEVQRGELIVPAPPSYWFEKLSGRYSSHFIRTESLLKSTCTIELLALGLLPRFHNWWKAQTASQRARTDIYIDTMGIWPLAEKLTQLHRSPDRHDTEYSIKSFKSYDGIAEWEPLPRPAFVIISATTSGGLEKKVRERIAPAAATVVTIVQLAGGSEKSTIDKDATLYEIPTDLVGAPSFNGLRRRFEAGLKELPVGDESIQLTGERFMSRGAKPRLVRLIYPALDDSTRLALATFARTHKISAGVTKFDGVSRWALTFDAADTFNRLTTAAGEQEPLLDAWLRNYAPPGPIAVVYPTASGVGAPSVAKAAKALANAAETALARYPGTQAIVLSSDELLASSTKLQHSLDKRGFVVVAPVIGSGFIYKQIGALLRNVQRSGPRLFLTYVSLPESVAQFEQLKKDLSRASDNISYEFRCKHSFPVGKLEQALDWNSERTLLMQLYERMAADGVVGPDTVRTRLDDIDGGIGLAGDNVFLPSLSGDSLALSGGFALWLDSEELRGPNLGGHVLLTMAVLLEASRTAYRNGTATSLGSSLFQQTLIDPENFTRYNDGVIQAAILRAAYTSELNYRSLPSASNDMRRLITKWIQLANYPAGGAAPEFLLALATGKLKLCEQDAKYVLDEAVKAFPKTWMASLASVARTMWASSSS